MLIEICDLFMEKKNEINLKNLQKIKDVKSSSISTAIGWNCVLNLLAFNADKF